MFGRLPTHIQRQTREAYRFFRNDPLHPSLHFKQVHATKPYYSARINIDYRVVGVRNGDEIVWFWIGSHTDYIKLIARL